MTVKTGGTLATTTLSGQQWPGQYGATSISDADIASIATAIFNDGDYPQPLVGAFSRMGLLYIPRRGVVRMLDGDWAMYDPSGFPYLIPRISMPTTLTRTGTTNTTTTLTVTVSALTAGTPGRATTAPANARACRPPRCAPRRPCRPGAARALA